MVLSWRETFMMLIRARHMSLDSIFALAHIHSFKINLFVKINFFFLISLAYPSSLASVPHYCQSWKSSVSVPCKPNQSKPNKPFVLVNWVFTVLLPSISTFQFSTSMHVWCGDEKSVGLLCCVNRDVFRRALEPMTKSPWVLMIKVKLTVVCEGRKVCENGSSGTTTAL